MQDSELKKLLQETCPVRPGQEERAWLALKEKLNAAPQTSGSWIPTWRIAGSLAAFTLVVAALSFFVGFESKALATAHSQSPGIYATAFYSRAADAQVVWLNGMEPASDRPTYLDPTTEVGQRPAPGSAQDPNSL